MESERIDIEPEFTLNGIATFTHDRLYVVGAMRENDLSISPYSGGTRAIALGRAEGPDVEAVDATLKCPARS